MHNFRIKLKVQVTEKLSQSGFLKSITCLLDLCQALCKTDALQGNK